MSGWNNGNQRKKHPLNKGKTRYLPQETPQIHNSMHLDPNKKKNTNMRKQKKYVFGTPYVVGPDKNNLTEGKGKNSRKVINNIFKDLKKDRNKCLNDDHESANS